MDLVSYLSVTATVTAFAFMIDRGPLRSLQTSWGSTKSGGTKITGTRWSAARFG